jgi:hypothetical protein
MPTNARNYIGAFVNDGKFVPSLRRRRIIDAWYSITFLSNYISKVVANACTEKIYIKWIETKRFGFDYLIAESIVTHSLMAQKTGDVINSKWNLNEWKIYKNYEGANITKKHLIKLPFIPPCTREILFPSMYLSANVAELEKQVLYRSSVHNGALYDHLVVDGLTVYVFQSSNQSAKSHLHNK